MDGSLVKKWMAANDIKPVELAVLLGSVSMGVVSNIISGEGAHKQTLDRLAWLMSLSKQEVNTRLNLLRTSAQISTPKAAV